MRSLLSQFHLRKRKADRDLGPASATQFNRITRGRATGKVVAVRTQKSLEALAEDDICLKEKRWHPEFRDWATTMSWVGYIVEVPTHRPREKAEREKCFQRLEWWRHLDDRHGIARCMKAFHWRIKKNIFLLEHFHPLQLVWAEGSQVSKIIEGFTPWWFCLLLQIRLRKAHVN